MSNGKADSESSWQVYIILASDDTLYTGITNNIRKRWRQHANKTGAKFFYGREPFALCYLEGGHNRSSASQREHRIKRLSRAKKWALIQSAYGPPLTDAGEIR